jgi:hypothetical protein
MVQCAYWLHEVDGTSLCVNVGGERHDLRGDQIPRAALAGVISNNLWSKLVKTELLLAVYDELSTLPKRVDYGEDLITMFCLTRRADRFAHVPDPVYRYRQNVLSMTGKSDAASLFAKVESLSWIFDQIRPALTRRAEPPDLVEELFTREFLEPIVAHLKRAREQGVLGPTGSPTSPAELGLLGTVIADAYGMYDTRSEPDDRSASSPQ